MSKKVNINEANPYRVPKAPGEVTSLDPRKNYGEDIDAKMDYELRHSRKWEPWEDTEDYNNHAFDKYFRVKHHPNVDACLAMKSRRDKELKDRQVDTDWKRHGENAPMGECKLSSSALSRIIAEHIAKSGLVNEIAWQTYDNGEEGVDKAWMNGYRNPRDARRKKDSLIAGHHSFRDSSREAFDRDLGGEFGEWKVSCFPNQRGVGVVSQYCDSTGEEIVYYPKATSEEPFGYYIYSWWENRKREHYRYAGQTADEMFGSSCPMNVIIPEFQKACKSLCAKRIGTSSYKDGKWDDNLGESVDRNFKKSLNEMDYRTYLSAAQKAKEQGDLHRASKLLRYAESMMAKQYETYNTEEKNGDTTNVLHGGRTRLGYDGARLGYNQFNRSKNPRADVSKYAPKSLDNERYHERNFGQWEAERPSDDFEGNDNKNYTRNLDASYGSNPSLHGVKEFPMSDEFRNKVNGISDDLDSFYQGKSTYSDGKWHNGLGESVDRNFKAAINEIGDTWTPEHRQEVYGRISGRN